MPAPKPSSDSAAGSGTISPVTSKRLVPEAQITVLAGDAGEPLTLPQDNTPFRQATGFELRYSLEDGVRKTIEFFRQEAGATAAAPPR